MKRFTLSLFALLLALSTLLLAGCGGGGASESASGSDSIRYGPYKLVGHDFPGAASDRQLISAGDMTKGYDHIELCDLKSHVADDPEYIGVAVISLQKTAAVA